MPNTTQPYGRQLIGWPDLGSDPGSTLHDQITTAIEILSDQVNSKWSGEQTLAASATYDLEHNFDTALASLKIFILESGSVLSKSAQASSYLITFIDSNTIRVQNITGGSKTFQVYVFPSWLNIRTEDLDPAIDVATTGKISANGLLVAGQAANSQTGSTVTISALSSVHTSLNGSGLASVQGITAPSPAAGVVAILTNNTGGVVSFSNDSGTAANRLLTGTGADLQLDNNASVLLKYDTSVSKWRVIGSTGGGSQAITVDQAHSFSVGQAIRYNGTTYVTAVASAANTAEVIGIVSKIVDADTFQYVPSGEVTGLSGLTPGEVYFLSDATPGALTITEPTTVGSVSLPVGIATSASKLMVSLKRGVVVGAANARTTISISNSGATSVVDVSNYNSLKLEGELNVTRSSGGNQRAYYTVEAAKNGAGTWQVSAGYTGDDILYTTLPTWDVSGSNLQVTMPTVTNFTSASLTYSLNAPAVGASLPLSISAGSIVPDGSAESPRGWTLSTNADYTITSTTANRIRITATSANRSLNLPSANIKAGYEVEAVGACSGGFSITIKASDGTTVETLRGSKGNCVVVALQDAPTTSSHWAVVTTYEEGTYTPTITPLSGSLGSYTATFNYVRTGNIVTVSGRYLAPSSGDTGTAPLAFSLPFSPAYGACGVGRRGGVDGVAITWQVIAGSVNSTLWTYNNTYPFGNNADLALTLSFRI